MEATRAKTAKGARLVSPSTSFPQLLQIPRLTDTPPPIRGRAEHMPPAQAAIPQTPQTKNEDARPPSQDVIPCSRRIEGQAPTREESEPTRLVNHDPIVETVAGVLKALEVGANNHLNSLVDHATRIFNLRPATTAEFREEIPREVTVREPVFLRFLPFSERQSLIDV